MRYSFVCQDCVVAKAVALIEKLVPRVVLALTLFSSLDLSVFYEHPLLHPLLELVLLIFDPRDDALIDCEAILFHAFNDARQFRHEACVCPRLLVQVFVERLGVV